MHSQVAACSICAAISRLRMKRLHFLTRSFVKLTLLVMFAGVACSAFAQTQAANLRTRYCWIDAKTGKPYPSLHLPRGSNVTTDSNGNIVPGDVSIVPGDPTHAFNAKTGQNLHQDPDGTWIDSATGEPYPTNDLPAGSNVTTDSNGNIVPGDVSIVPGDPTHAFNAKTGQNLVRVPCPPPTATTIPPTPTKTGCIGIGMTTPGAGQDAASKLAPVRMIPGGTNSGFAVDVKTPPGLNTIIFTTQRKNRIEVYLPNRLFAGKTFSGSMKVEIKNAGDQDELSGYSIRIGGQPTPLSSGVFSVALPDAAADSTAALVLVDKKGKQKAGVSLPLYPALSSLPREFDLPSSGTSGDLIVVHGPIEGAIDPTDYIKVGGKNIQLLAKSANQLVALNTSDVAGLTEIECRTNGSVAKSPFRNLTLKLWADKYNLLKGEGTTAHILVAGLERLEAPAKMTIETTGAVSMTGGNSQALSVTSSEVKPDGTYATDRALSSYEAGGFGVTVTVTVSPNCGSPDQP